MRKFDLEAEHVATILASVGPHLGDLPLYLYGSRATGRSRRNSDVDLCVRGETALSRAALEAARDALSASDLPYLCDLSDWHALEPAFRAQIASTWVRLNPPF